MIQALPHLDRVHWAHSEVLSGLVISSLIPIGIGAYITSQGDWSPTGIARDKVQ
jgi:hypothetical protein